ncbi:multidrug ABC transporter [Bacillus cereus]|nr:multidrug ABC transporter [Bacillus cereus]
MTYKFHQKTSLQEYDSKLREYANPYVIIGYSLLGINAGLNIFALKQASALESLSYLIISMFGWYFLGEIITKEKVIGNIIIEIRFVVVFHTLRKYTLIV